MGRVGASGMPLLNKVAKKPMNSDMSQQIIDSAAEDGGMTTGQEDEEDDYEDDIPAYGFPSQPSRSKGTRNRCKASDIDQLISDGGKNGEPLNQRCIGCSTT